MQTITQNQTPPVEEGAEEFITPVVNIFEEPNGYLLEAEMPGVSKAGLEITLAENEITLIGRRSPPAVGGEALFQECPVAHYRRVFQLDPAIDTQKIAARMENGILTLTLPKSERVKPRKIVVSD